MNKKITLHLKNIILILYNIKKRGSRNFLLAFLYIRIIFTHYFLKYKYINIKKHPLYYSDIEQLTTPILEFSLGFYPSIMQNELIIDCGANIGMIPRLYHYEESFNFYYEGYEPDCDLFQILIKNTSFLGKSYELAITNFDGEVDFYSETNMNKTGSSILTNNDNHILRKVKCSTLEGIICEKEIGLLKIDIEGAEYLLDWENLDFSNVRSLYLEVHPNKNSFFGKIIDELEVKMPIYIRSDFNLYLSKNKFYNIIVYGLR